MNKSYWIKFLLLSSFVFLLMGNFAVGANQTSERLDIVKNYEALEEQGLGNADAAGVSGEQNTFSAKIPRDNRTGVLLIPNSADDIVSKYDPFDGDFLGILIAGHSDFRTPINSIPGPDGNIYVSDQVADAVFVFDTLGTYLYTYADTSDGLNNIRGIDFRGTNLFVTSGDDYVAEFNGPHSRLPDFINDGSNPFDILFLEDERALLSDIGTTDAVRLYNADGTFSNIVFSVTFPEQLQFDTQDPGDYLCAAFTGNHVTDFDLDGTIHQTTSWFYGRGVYRLGNGNLLVTKNDGVYEIAPGTGTIIQQKSTGSAHFIELYVPPVLEIGWVEGVVTEASARNPIEGVYVLAEGTAISDTTNSLGQYFLASLATGTYNISFSHSAYEDTIVTGVVITEDDTTVVNVEMVQLPGQISGLVENDSLNPIEGVYVLAEGTLISDSTDSFGQYSLDSMIAGTYDISFSHPDYVDTVVIDVIVNPGQTTEVDMVMSTAPSGYQYLPADMGMYYPVWPPAVQGGDVTYYVNFMRQYVTSIPCYFDGPLGSFWASADVNGSCAIDGADLSTLVSVMRNVLDPMYCDQYPTVWPTPLDLPPTAPAGWPNCDNSPVATGIKIIPVDIGK